MNLPRLVIKQWDNQHNPSGIRNLELPLSGFIKIVDTSTSGQLDFGYLENTTSGNFAGTRLVTANVQSMGDAATIRNLRFYLSSISAWGAGTYRFLWKKQVGFTSGLQLSLSDVDVPTTMPSSGNLSSTQNDIFIQTAAESGCSQYVYLDVYANTDVPAKVYGGPGANSFRFRLLYDFL